MRLLHVRPDELQPWVPQLQTLERDISYPVGTSDRFVISHGDAYHPFFSSLGDAHFLLALDGDTVVGCLAGVRKEVLTPRGPLMGAYLGDLKVTRAWRGRGVAARLYARALTLSLQRWGALHWRFAFGAAMRGERGDVMRSAKGFHVMKLGRPFALLDVYFAQPEVLAGLDVRGAPEPPRTPGLDLSPRATSDVFSTVGKKDFVLESTGAPWKLVHLPRGPSGWGASHAGYVRRAGAALLHRSVDEISVGLTSARRSCAPVSTTASHQPTSGSGDDVLACFSLDARLAHERDFLASRGVVPSAVATVYGFSTSRAVRGHDWVHLATSEI
jgi:GNAT superfamily N-acetyltransferase